MSLKNKYKEYLKSNLETFKSKLKSNDSNRNTSYFLVNKEFFSSNERKNFNKELLINNIINENKNFYILDEPTWRAIKSDYGEIEEIKIKQGVFVYY